MLIKIIGILWILLGILFILKPQILQKRLQKKSTKKVRKNLFLLALFLAFTLILASLKSQGILPKIIMILGIIGIIKAFTFLNAKAAEKLISWISSKPVSIFRLGGVAYVLLGIIMWKFL